MIRRLPSLFARQYPLSSILRRIRIDCTGQTTVEYLVVGLAMIALISCLAVFGSRVQEGLFVEHASESASHAITTNTAGSIGDVLLF